MKKNEKEILLKVANTIRGLAMDAVETAKSGHPGLPLGCAEIAAYLYGKGMNYNPSDPQWINRDRFVLSAGHGSMLLYACLHLAGFGMSLENIKKFRQLKSAAAGHPEYHESPGIETTTGPLGQGLANAVGMALGQKMMEAKFGVEKQGLLNAKFFVLASDGDIMEGISSEASSLAGHLKLDNLIILYDSNDICLDGETRECLSEDTQKRYQAYGWHAETINGHHIEEIERAVQAARRRRGKPSLIIAKTIIGYGSPNLAESSDVHGKAMGQEEVNLTKKKLGIPLEPLFNVPEEVKSYFDEQRKKGELLEKEWKENFEKWSKINSEKAKLWETHLGKSLPENIEEIIKNIPMKPDLAGRQASNTILQVLHDQLPFIIGGSADLSNSDATLMKAGGIVKPRQYNARNLKFGVREFAMGAMTSGLALQGMIFPFCGTFLTFSDYMRNAIRLASFMKLKIVYQFTHDSIWLGEDGPTHQPIEHVAALRTIPGLTVIRPADSTEVKGAWAEILKHQGPVALILTRQSLKDLPYTKFEDVARGAYILKKESRPQVDYCLLATGSEVALALGAADKLEAQQKSVRVVSFPSFELFNRQDRVYQDQVLTGPVRQFWSIEALSPFGWHQYIGREGKSIAMNHFGLSAPGKVVAEHFGFSVDKIVERILNG